MTRVTSIGLPRKSFVASAAEDAQAATAKAGPSTRAAGAGSPPPAKKGKKRRGQPRDGKRKREGGEGGAGERNVPSSVGGGASSSKGWGRDPELAKRMRLSAQHADERRQRRMDDRHSHVTCFACRAIGHAARDCPNVLLAAQGEASAGNGAAVSGGKRKGGKLGGEVTGAGRCYRCNATDHPLSRCSQLADPLNPTPYATCFVCLASGHLSSQCPTSGRGVYPKGGSCKVCGSVAHRAKDCPEEGKNREDRRKPAQTEDVLLGAGDEVAGNVGADEDDFMVARRAGLLEEKGAKKAKKLKRVLVADLGAAAGEGTAVVSAPIAVKAKPKVVKF